MNTFQPHFFLFSVCLHSFHRNTMLFSQTMHLVWAAMSFLSILRQKKNENNSLKLRLIYFRIYAATVSIFTVHSSHAAAKCFCSKFINTSKTNCSGGRHTRNQRPIIKLYFCKTIGGFMAENEKYGKIPFTSLNETTIFSVRCMRILFISRKFQKVGSFTQRRIKSLPNFNLEV